MAHTKAGGSTKNLRDSRPKYLGIKLSGGEAARTGMIIVKQRGSHFVAGEGARMGKDDCIYAMRAGKVVFKDKRKTRFDGSRSTYKQVSVE
jgi:large subunit ribosomal protein L27